MQDFNRSFPGMWHGKVSRLLILRNRQTKELTMLKRRWAKMQTAVNELSADDLVYTVSPITTEGMMIVVKNGQLNKLTALATSY
jgi:hypothetical protein